MWKKYHDSDESESQAALDEAKNWIANKDNPPRPRPEAKRFHRRVPQWMRSAIRRGLVKTNGEEVYVVYSREQEAIRVEIVDRSTLKPYRGGR